MIKEYIMISPEML